MNLKSVQITLNPLNVNLQKLGINEFMVPNKVSDKVSNKVSDKINKTQQDGSSLPLKNKLNLLGTYVYNKLLRSDGGIGRRVGFRSQCLRRAGSNPARITMPI